MKIFVKINEREFNESFTYRALKINGMPQQMANKLKETKDAMQ